MLLTLHNVGLLRTHLIQVPDAVVKAARQRHIEILRWFICWVPEMLWYATLETELFAQLCSTRSPELLRYAVDTLRFPPLGTWYESNLAAKLLLRTPSLMDVDTLEKLVDRGLNIRCIQWEEEKPSALSCFIRHCYGMQKLNLYACCDSHALFFQKPLLHLIRLYTEPPGLIAPPPRKYTEE